MNPPYGGTLHLKILSKVVAEFENVVNLSPVLPLQLPENTVMADYELNGLSELEVIGKDDARIHFQNRIPGDLGIYKFSPGGDLQPDAYELRGLDAEKCHKLVAEIRKHDTFKNHVIMNEPLRKYAVCYSHMNGLHENSHNFVYHGGVAPDGKSYRDNVKNQHKNDFPRSHFEFDTFEEAENFRKYVFLPTFKWIETVTQPGLLRDFSLLPYFDFTKEITEEYLQEIFR